MLSAVLFKKGTYYFLETPPLCSAVFVRSEIQTILRKYCDKGRKWIKLESCNDANVTGTLFRHPKIVFEVAKVFSTYLMIALMDL